MPDYCIAIKKFQNMLITNSTKRLIFKLNVQSCGNMGQVLNLGASVTINQQFPPRIPRMDMTKHNRPYLPRRALM